MKADYEAWLKREGYDQGTIGAQLYRVARVEEFHGCLDAHYEHDRLAGMIATLTYSTEDQRNDRPNPSAIPFIGNKRNNLASYKSAVLWYRRFRDGEVSGEPANSAGSAPPRRLQSKPASKAVPRLGAKTLTDFGLDGMLAFEALIASSQYQSTAQAVASLTLFTHPDTVRQTEGKAVFPTIRNQKRVGEYAEHEGRQVLLDDNKSPKDAFLWANGLSRRGADTQFNHVYASSLDADAYTALPNICMTPAFIAKLTDTNREIRHLLQYRSYQLYGWVPTGKEPPRKPDSYEVLEWAAPLPAIGDVRAAIMRAMATKPKDRTVKAAMKLGWLFS